MEWTNTLQSAEQFKTTSSANNQSTRSMTNTFAVMAIWPVIFVLGHTLIYQAVLAMRPSEGTPGAKGIGDKIE